MHSSNVPELLPAYASGLADSYSKHTNFDRCRPVIRIVVITAKVTTCILRRLLGDTRVHSVKSSKIVVHRCRCLTIGSKLRDSRRVVHCVLMRYHCLDCLDWIMADCITWILTESNYSTFMSSCGRGRIITLQLGLFKCPLGSLRSPSPVFRPTTAVSSRGGHHLLLDLLL